MSPRGSQPEVTFPGDFRFLQGAAAIYPPESSDETYLGASNNNAYPPSLPTMTSIPRDFWSSSLIDPTHPVSTPPKRLLAALKDHHSNVRSTHNALAEYLKARANWENEAVNGLTKLRNKHLANAQQGAPGIERALWDALADECAEEIRRAQARSAELAREADSITLSLGGPLTNLASTVETRESTASSALKSLEPAITRCEKAERKDPSSAKASQAQAELDEARQQLYGKALPQLLEASQALEHDRLEHLQAFGVRWATTRAETAAAVQRENERRVAEALGRQVDEEVQTAVRKLAKEAGQSVVTPSTNGGDVGASAAAAAAPPTMTTSNAAPSITSVSTPRRMQSIRRGTLGSTTDSVPSSPFASTANRGASPGGASASTTGGGAPSHQKQSLTSTLRSKFGRKSSKGPTTGGGDSSPSAFATNGRAGGGRERAGSNATGRSSSFRGGPTGGGQSGAFESLNDVPDDVVYESPRDALNRGRPDLAAAAAAPQAAPSSAAGLVDADGFSVPPADAGRAPWEQATIRSRNLLDDDDDDNVTPQSGGASAPLSGSTGAPRFNLAPEPVIPRETEAEREAAIQKLQSTLGAPVSAASGPTRRGTVGRGRRDVRNTTFIPGGVAALAEDVPLAQAAQVSSSSPISAIQTQQLNGNPRQVVARQDSTASSTTPQQPAITVGSGLQAALTETVNIVSRNGIVQRAQITGELSLTARDLDVPAGGPLHIRLDEFQQLEKVAPNPRFLSQVPDRPGEYYLDAQALTEASGRPLLLKYQLHVPADRAGDFAPLEIHPQWKCQPGDARLLLSYKANLEGRLKRAAAGGLAAPRLTDVAFIASLAGPTVENIQAKPADGEWDASRHRMTWNVEDVEMSAESALSAGRIMARFKTEGEEAGVPEGVIVKWRAEGTLTSGLGLSIVDGQGWELQDTQKVVVSGKYIAE